MQNLFICFFFSLKLIHCVTKSRANKARRTRLVRNKHALRDSCCLCHCVLIFFFFLFASLLPSSLIFICFCHIIKHSHIASQFLVFPIAAKKSSVPFYPFLNKKKLGNATMAQAVEEWYKQMPVITRSYLTAAVVTTIGCSLDVNPLFSSSHF